MPIIVIGHHELKKFRMIDIIDNLKFLAEPLLDSLNLIFYFLFDRRRLDTILAILCIFLFVFNYVGE